MWCFHSNSCTLGLSSSNLIFREIGRDNEDIWVISSLFLMIFSTIRIKMDYRWIIENFRMIEDVIILREGEEEEIKK